MNAVRKVLFVGLGGIGQRHLRNLRALLGDRVEVIAWRTRRQRLTLTDTLQVDPGVDLEEKYAVRAVPSLEEALAEKPDVAFITNPTSLHVSAALACAQAGCHLFLEKPVSHSLDGTAELLRVVRERKLVAMVGYQLRQHPCLQQVSRWLAAGRVGRLLAARFEIGEYLPAWHAYEDFRQMYAARKDLGGGVILSQIHELDLSLWFFGAPVRVFALGGPWSSLGLDVDDTASMLFECRHGDRALPVHVQADYLQRPPRRCLDIVGDAGRIACDLRGGVAERFDAADGSVERVVPPALQRNQLFLDQMQQFLASIAGQARPAVDLEAGLVSLRAALAAHESIRTGAAVDIGGAP